MRMQVIQADLQNKKDRWLVLSFFARVDLTAYQVEYLRGLGIIF
jgi:hypothetical protein